MPAFHFTRHAVPELCCRCAQTVNRNMRNKGAYRAVHVIVVESVSGAFRAPENANRGPVTDAQEAGQRGFEGRKKGVPSGFPCLLQQIVSQVTHNIRRLLIQIRQVRRRSQPQSYSPGDIVQQENAKRFRPPSRPLNFEQGPGSSGFRPSEACFTGINRDHGSGHGSTKRHVFSLSGTGQELRFYRGTERKEISL